MVSLKRIIWHHNLYLFGIVSEKIAVGDWNVDIGNSVLCIIHYLNFWHLQTISHINIFRILKGQHHDMPSLTRSQLYAPLAERVWTNPKSNRRRVERAVRLAGFPQTKFNRNLEWQAEPWWRASIWRSHRKVVIKQCSYHNNIIDIQNRLPYSKVVYPAIIVLFSCLMEVNHGVRTGPDYPFG